MHTQIYWKYGSQAPIGILILKVVLIVHTSTYKKRKKEENISALEFHVKKMLNGKAKTHVNYKKGT